MNSQSILMAKISYLSGNSESDLDSEMKTYVANHPELAKELQFVEAFWQQKSEVELEQPSAALDQRFYQMLNQAKVVQNDQQIQSEKKQVVGLGLDIWQWLVSLFSPKPLAQFASLALVFTIGLNMNSFTSSNNQSLAGLQKQVESLSSLVALSMINNGSTSERLTGVSYSLQTNEQNEQLNMALMKLLNTDKSTAVRLSVIDALSARASVIYFEAELLDSIDNQRHPMVQIALIRLLVNKGSNNSLSKLKDKSANNQISTEASEFIDQLLTQSYI